ncbi:MAG: hypothetical protein HQK60_18105 [Deltaproteobacteria bacterium]|nr:hypothetical protein [Deltaproteobacteria bacterium]
MADVRKKESITEGDVCLIHIDNKPATFARVEEISLDRKPGWWQVRFLLLVLPMQEVVWIIDNDQITGADFTMGGTPIRIERIPPATPTNGKVMSLETSPLETGQDDDANEKTTEKRQEQDGKVIQLIRKKPSDD